MRTYYRCIIAEGLIERKWEHAIDASLLLAEGGIQRSYGICYRCSVAQGGGEGNGDDTTGDCFPDDKLRESDSSHQGWREREGVGENDLWFSISFWARDRILGLGMFFDNFLGVLKLGNGIEHLKALQTSFREKYWGSWNDLGRARSCGSRNILCKKDIWSLISLFAKKNIGGFWICFWEERKKKILPEQRAIWGSWPQNGLQNPEMERDEEGEARILEEVELIQVVLDCCSHVLFQGWNQANLRRSASCMHFSWTGHFAWMSLMLSQHRHVSAEIEWFRSHEDGLVMFNDTSFCMTVIHSVTFCQCRHTISGNFLTEKPDSWTQDAQQSLSTGSRNDELFMKEWRDGSLAQQSEPSARPHTHAYCMQRCTATHCKSPAIMPIVECWQREKLCNCTASTCPAL